MGAAALIDLRTRRIPNLLTASLTAAGIGIAAAGLGRIGLGASILGCLLGLAFMLPGHVFGATGAGDVKLLAAAGALLGPVRHHPCLSQYGDRGRRSGAPRGAAPPAPAANPRRGRAARGGGGTATRRSRSPATDNRFAYGPAIAIGVVLVALNW